MLEYYATNGAPETDAAEASSSGGNGAEDLNLQADDLRMVREEAVRSVAVPSSVIQLLADLRTYLQEKVEPPVYVSDRRLVKSVAMMQVCASVVILLRPLSACCIARGGHWGHVLSLSIGAAHVGFKPSCCRDDCR